MPEPAALSYSVQTASRQGVTRDLPHGPEDLQWVANTVTLVYGAHDAVLVDTFTSIQQNADLVEWVRSFDRTLTHVYITHGHGDHLFGIGQLLSAFPGARAVGTAATVADAPINDTPAFRQGFWEKLFPGQIPVTVYPEPLEEGFVELEGHRLEVIDAGHTDTAHTTSLWIPDLRLLVAGDVVYNDTHPFTTESTTESREHWAQAAEHLAALDPAVVVAGHKKPELPDSPDAIAATADYLRDFNRVEAETGTAIDLYDRMLDLHPRRANPGSLWGGAKTAKDA
ncbi:MBL fold metallo-hydrolase [Gryllotalpicola reticulitermitis]|uniref:MBL fold metallo-hydrolase n=1 Tax=Gryllotalpicola reticulitermitis TaxID=1184153 RepID=A0ABV8Q993_9MICO